MESDTAKSVSEICYFLTLILNGTLIYLTAYHTKRISLTYRQMIIGFASLGIVFSTFDLVVRPIMHSYNGCFLFFSLEGVFRNSKEITEVLLAIYSALYSSILSYLTIQYIYRTCILIKPEFAEYFRGWKLSFCFAYVFFFGFGWGYITYVHAYPDEYALSYVRQELYDQYTVNADEIPLFLMLAFEEKPDTEKAVRFQSIICIFGDMGIMSFQYIIMMTCGVIMYRKIRHDLRDVASSDSQSKFQKQIFKALVFQLAAPSILVHMPAVPLFFAPFFDMKISFRTRVVVYFFSFYPLLDSLILFSIVSDYKSALKKIAAKWVLKILSLVQNPQQQNSITLRSTQVHPMQMI